MIMCAACQSCHRAVTGWVNKRARLLSYTQVCACMGFMCAHKFRFYFVKKIYPQLERMDLTFLFFAYSKQKRSKEVC